MIAIHYWCPQQAESMAHVFGWRAAYESGVWKSLLLSMRDGAADAVRGASWFRST